MSLKSEIKKTRREMRKFGRIISKIIAYEKMRKIQQEAKLRESLLEKYLFEKNLDRFVRKRKFDFEIDRAQNIEEIADRIMNEQYRALTVPLLSQIAKISKTRAREILESGVKSGKYAKRERMLYGKKFEIYSPANNFYSYIPHNSSPAKYYKFRNELLMEFIAEREITVKELNEKVRKICKKYSLTEPECAQFKSLALQDLSERGNIRKEGISYVFGTSKPVKSAELPSRHKSGISMEKYKKLLAISRKIFLYSMYEPLTRDEFVSQLQKYSRQRNLKEIAHYLLADLKKENYIVELGSGIYIMRKIRIE